jgi:hypothetical protein
MCYNSDDISPLPSESFVMPDYLRKFIGLLLIFAAIGVASCQALWVSCCAPATPSAVLVPRN